MRKWGRRLPTPLSEGQSRSALHLSCRLNYYSLNELIAALRSSVAATVKDEAVWRGLTL